jgi:hypothetical protein
MLRPSGWTLLVLVAVAAPAMAAEDDSLKGRVEAGYRNADVNGNTNKYREDVNLSDDAIRLFDFGLEYGGAEDGWFDRLLVDAQGLGGEPYQTARIALEKDGRYELDLRYRSSAYFYQDDGYWYSAQGDLHSWNSNRRFYDFSFKYNLSRSVDLRAGVDSVDWEGRSTTSRDVQRDEFVLDRPLDQSATTYWVGADFRVGWADFTIEERFYRFENDRTLTTANDDGVESGGAFLNDYAQFRSEDIDAPTTRVQVRGRPLDWMRFDLRYAHIDAESDYAMDGQWDGLDYTDAPFQTTATNAGTVDRTSDLWDLDLIFGLTPSIDLWFDYSNRTYDQDGTIDLVETQIGGAEAGTVFVQGDLENDLEFETYGLTVDWQATRALSVAFGAGFQERSKQFELSGPEVVTERTNYRVRLRWRPNPIWNLKLDYEEGDDDDPVTPISPTSTDRLRFQANVRAMKDLLIAFNFIDKSSENGDSYPLGIPTDDTPPATDIFLAQFDVTSWSVFFNWSYQALDVVLGYSDADVNSDAHIVYVTGSTSVPSFDIFTTRQRTDYIAEQEVINLDLRYAIGSAWSLGFKTILYENTGSFPVKNDYYRADARYQFTNGLFARLAFDRYDYDENNPFAGDYNPVPDPSELTLNPDVNDYDADLWTLSVGYRF